MLYVNWIPPRQWGPKQKISIYRDRNRLIRDIWLLIYIVFVPNKKKRVNTRKSYTVKTIFNKEKPNIRYCEICWSSVFLEIHHKDKNKDNNNINNLIKICLKCHIKAHEWEPIVNLMKSKLIYLNDKTCNLVSK
jgi:5-methylcytosine-specific restriction endonuclease McrA